MKQKNKKIIAIVLIGLIILAGIIVVSVWGFNKELKFAQGQKIEIYVGQNVDQKKIKEIADDVLGMHNMVQTIEIYQDMVTIKSPSITEEQRNSIISKMKEIYEIEQTQENTTIENVPATRIRDMYKQYVVPFIISGILVVAYLVVRYYKKGILKVLSTAIIVPVVAELLLFSWMAIVTIPIGRFTPVLVILVYIASIWYATKQIEK